MLRVMMVAALAGLAAPASAQKHTETASFETCLATIRKTASELGVAPVNIVETSTLRVVRFPTSDGSILVTCSGPDRKMTIETSSARCGRDVRC